MPKALNVGSLNLDMVYQVEHIVRPGETLSSASFACLPGGKGLNQSVALARAGAPVRHFGAVGQDGLMLTDLLKESGVDTTEVNVQNGETGRAIIQCDSHGENAIILQPGLNHKLEQRRLEEAMDRMQRGDYLVLQNETNLVEEAARKGSKRGLTVCWNAAPFTAEASHMPLECIHLLIVNETEAAGLSGRQNPHEALAYFTERMPDATIIITLGAQGALASQAGRHATISAHPCGQVVDTTAAGDTFTGYFVAEQMRGGSLESCLSLASRAAAMCIGKAGAAPSIPKREDLPL